MPPENERRPGEGAPNEVSGAGGHADDQSLAPIDNEVKGQGGGDHSESASPRSMIDAALAYAAAGLVPVPLKPREKVPAGGKGWPGKAVAAASDLAAVRRCWESAPTPNVGLLHGHGTVALDVDGPGGQRELDKLEAQLGKLPRTATVRSGRADGGKHLIFRHAGPLLKNRKFKAQEGDGQLDVIAHDKQTVAPPSVHPGTGATYEWEIGLDELATLPPPWVEHLANKPPDRNNSGRREQASTSRPPKKSSQYARAALAKELVVVRSAAPGERNDTLNRSAFNLGQLVQAGELDEHEVRESLDSAALEAGDGWDGEGRKIAGTIQSGLGAGMRNPRGARHNASALRISPSPDGGTQAEPKVQGPGLGGPVDVYVPGAHRRPPYGDYFERTAAEFVHDVLKAGRPGALYLMGDALGEVRGGEFCQVDEQRLRGVLSEHVRLIKGVEEKVDGSPAYVAVLCPVNVDHTRLVIANAPAIRKPLRELEQVVSTPTIRADGTIFDEPGYDQDTRTVYSPKLVYPPVPRIDDRAKPEGFLEELLAPFVEFPFSTPADRAAVLAAMFTMAARPAIRGNVPGLLVVAPTWRVGKGLLVEAITMSMTGSIPKVVTAPAGRADDRAAEWEKKIVAILRRAPRVVMLDNLPDGSHLQSDSLASLLTAPGCTYEGRDLGRSIMVRVSNRAFWTLTGCNVTVEGDLAGRLLSVRLSMRAEDTDAENPERRNFKVPNLRKHVEDLHPKLLTITLALLRRFIEIGRPQHGGPPLGGFEAWDELVRSAVVWATQECGWRSDPCDTQQRLQSAAADRAGASDLFAAWHAALGERPIAVADLMAKARSNDELRAVFDSLGWIDSDGNRRTQHIGIELARWVDVVRGGLVLRREGKRAGSGLWAVHCAGSPQVPLGSPSGSPAPESALATPADAICGGPRGLGGLFGGSTRGVESMDCSSREERSGKVPQVPQVPSEDRRP